MSDEKRYKAQPQELPPPTYWPFFTALSVVLMFWGILTSWIITGIGFILFTIALAGWIFEIYKELPKKDEHEL